MTASLPGSWPPGRLDRRSWLAGGLLAAAGVPAARAGQAARIGEVVSWPSISLLDGATLAASDWQDTAAVVVFWATWCAFCRRHNVHVDRLYREAAGTRLRVIGVALHGDAATVRRHVLQQGYRFPVALAGAALRDRFSERRVVPLTCTVDRQGRLREVIPGEMAEADVLALARLARPSSGA